MHSATPRARRRLRIDLDAHHLAALAHQGAGDVTRGRAELEHALAVADELELVGVGVVLRRRVHRNPVAVGGARVGRRARLLHVGGHATRRWPFEPRASPGGRAHPCAHGSWPGARCRPSTPVSRGSAGATNRWGMHRPSSSATTMRSRFSYLVGRVGAHLVLVEALLEGVVGEQPTDRGSPSPSRSLIVSMAWMEPMMPGARRARRPRRSSGPSRRRRHQPRAFGPARACTGEVGWTERRGSPSRRQVCSRVAVRPLPGGGHHLGELVRAAGWIAPRSCSSSRFRSSVRRSTSRRMAASIDVSRRWVRT